MNSLHNTYVRAEEKYKDKIESEKLTLKEYACKKIYANRYTGTEERAFNDANRKFSLPSAYNLFYYHLNGASEKLDSYRLLTGKLGLHVRI